MKEEVILILDGKRVQGNLQIPEPYEVVSILKEVTLDGVVRTVWEMRTQLVKVLPK